MEIALEIPQTAFDYSTEKRINQELKLVIGDKKEAQKQIKLLEKKIFKIGLEHSTFLPDGMRMDAVQEVIEEMIECAVTDDEFADIQSMLGHLTDSLDKRYYQ